MVVEEVVGAAGQLGEAVHRALHDVWQLVVEAVGRLASLEVDVRVLHRAADDRVLGGEPARALLGDETVVDHRADGRVVDLIDLLHLVGSAEAVEEMHERHARLERRGVRDECEVLRLLHARGGDHRDARLAARHDVRMVAEDACAVHGEGARGHVEDGREQFTRHAVEVRNHQQEALRRGECASHRSGGDGAVHGARRAALALHLHHFGNGAPDVRTLRRHVFVGLLAHRGRGRYRIYERHVAAGVGDSCDRQVGVGHRFHVNFNLSTAIQNRQFSAKINSIQQIVPRFKRVDAAAVSRSLP